MAKKQKSHDGTDFSGLIYGVNPVLEALRGETPIEKLVVARGRTGEELQSILDAARKKKVPFEFRDRAEIDRLAGGKSQGVAAFCKPYNYYDLGDILSRQSRSQKKNKLVVLLDSISDPQNLGALIRTSYVFGADGVIIPERRAAPVTPVVIKASAGAVQHIPVSRVVNLAQTIDELKKEGFWIYGAAANTGRDFVDFDYSGNTALVLGSEGEGLRGLVEKKCDFLVSIPMAGDLDSLNVSVAAGIILQEIARKRV